MDIQQRQDKMKIEAKSYDFEHFLLHIASWFPVVLYKNNNQISKFPPTHRSMKVIHHETYQDYRDGEWQQDYIDFDETKKFFEQFQNLWNIATFPNLISFGWNTNADYGDAVRQSKNIYLSFGVIVDCENVMYSLTVKDGCSNIYNSCFVMESCENIYESIGVAKSYNILYSHFVHNSANIWFSSNMIGCSECLFCDNLQNTSYCIDNKVLDKEEYFKKKEDLLSQKTNFDLWKSNVSKKAQNIVSENASGNCIMESENIENGQFVYHVSGGKNIMFAWTTDGNKDIYNTISAGSPYGSDMYNCVSINGDNIYCSVHCGFWSNTYYSYYLNECSYCIGCIWLMNKQFYIFNKQYTKEEWFILADKIFEKMDQEGTLGKFFPGDICPFYINDTIGGMLLWATKEQAENNGFLRREEKVNTDTVVHKNIVTIDQLSWFESTENGRAIDAKIADCVIEDTEGNHYKILPLELAFLIKYQLPLPRKHRLDRMKENFRLT